MPESQPHPYHWTPAARGCFIEVLAKTGSVARAAQAVGKTRGAAYKLRRRKAEGAFAIAWDAAILVAREYVGDTILPDPREPVIHREVVTASGRKRWRHVDPLLGPGLGLSLVTRLEQAGTRIDRDPARLASAQALVPRLFDRICQC